MGHVHGRPSPRQNTVLFWWIHRTFWILTPKGSESSNSIVMVISDQNVVSAYTITEECALIYPSQCLFLISSSWKWLWLVVQLLIGRVRSHG